MNSSIKISCSKDNLKLVRNFVTNFLEPYSLSDIDQNQIILAIDEITANLIMHANQEDNSKFVSVTVCRVGDGFIFELSDNGKSFKQESYQKVEEPDLPRKIREGIGGGMGIALVKRIMDKVEFTSNGNKNICRLYKKV